VYFSKKAKCCNDSLQGGHILAHFKVPARPCLQAGGTGREVIRQPPDNNFDKTSVQIQVGLNNPKPNAHIHGYTLQSNLLLLLLLLLSL